MKFLREDVLNLKLSPVNTVKCDEMILWSICNTNEQKAFIVYDTSKTTPLGYTVMLG